MKRVVLLVAVCVGLTVMSVDGVGPGQAAEKVKGARAPLQGQAATAPPSRQPDVIYVPTPEEVVDAMLKVAQVTSKDVVYDLGCGDGRIVVTAAKQYGARGVGIDIDPQRIKEARENVEKAGVGDRVQILQADLFETDLRPATVVTLYLLESLNLKLKPKLIEELRPGARVVSHAFSMGAWKADEELDINGRRVFYWKMPPTNAAAGGQ